MEKRDISEGHSASGTVRQKAGLSRQKRDVWSHYFTDTSNGGHICPICKQKFSRKFNLKKHIIQQHPDPENLQLGNENTSENEYCEFCQMVFLKKEDLVLHKLQVHKDNFFTADVYRSEEYNNKVIHCCSICKIEFATAGSKRRHMKRRHKQSVYEQSRNNLKCSECSNSFVSHSSFIDHIKQNHQKICIKIENHNFPDVSTFEVWKADMEKETASSYIRRASCRSSKGNIIMYYYCHRSGNFISRGSSLRRLKIGGSCKINYFCPARLRVEIPVTDINRQIDVQFHCTHVGHECNIGYLRLSKVEKNKIAEKIQTGIPFHQIMHSSENVSPTKHTRFTQLAEKDAIVNELNIIPRNVDKLKEDAKTAILSFLPLIENIKKEETLKKILTSLSTLRDTCEAMENPNKQQPPVVTYNLATKKTQPQILFLKKKK